MQAVTYNKKKFFFFIKVFKTISNILNKTIWFFLAIVAYQKINSIKEISIKRKKIISFIVCYRLHKIDIILSVTFFIIASTSKNVCIIIIHTLL